MWARVRRRHPLVQLPFERDPFADDERRSSGWRGRAHVGDEIADREIGLVADAGDDRQHRLEHRARDDFLVERPQILERATAAADDQNIDARVHVRGADRRGNLARGAGALHGRRIQDHGHRRKAARQRRQHVAQCRCMPRRDDADPPRKWRQAALARRFEQPRGCERCLHLHEPLVQRSEPREAYRLDAELQFAARVVDRRHGAHFDGEPFAKREREPLRLVAEEHAADLRARVLQGEIEMAGCGSRAPRDLAADPGEADARARAASGCPRQTATPAQRAARGGGVLRVRRTDRICALHHHSCVSLLRSRSIVPIALVQSLPFVQDKKGFGVGRAHSGVMFCGNADACANAVFACRTATTGR